MKTAGEDMLKKMLPIFDDFERAMDAHKKSGHTEALKPSAFEEGIYLIFHKLQHTFEAVGLKAMDSKDVDFNSDYHEAIAKIPAPDAAQKGKIIDTVEKGYLFNGKIIRHAKVVIGE
jgi:molecular chaperone GrpE